MLLFSADSRIFAAMSTLVAVLRRVFESSASVRVAKRYRSPTAAGVFAVKSVQVYIGHEIPFPRITKIERAKKSTSHDHSEHERAAQNDCGDSAYR